MPATSSGALAVLPGWAFTGPFAWGADAGIEPIGAELPAVAAVPAVPPASGVADALPYLDFREGLDAGTSARRLVAAEVLWQALRASRFGWQRSITLEGQLLSFYSPTARIAVEIEDPEATGPVARATDERLSTESGVRLVPISIADVEQRCATVVGWLDGLCAERTRELTVGTATPTGRWRRRRPTSA